MPPNEPATRSTPGSSTRSANALASAASASTTTRASICESCPVRRDESFTLEQHAIVEIELAAGGVVIRAGATGVVKVSIDSSAPDGVEIAQVGDDISIRAKG